MENRAHALVAGLFVLLFAGLAFFVLWWFGGQREDLRQVVVVSRLPVNGLNPQATVRYRGVRVGKVKSIQFGDSPGPGTPSDILIRLAIDDDIPLTSKTFARLAFQGVTGQASLALDELPGAAQPLAGPVPRIALQASLVSEGIDSGLDTLRQVKEVTARINALLDDENRARITRTLANVDRLSGQAADAGERLPEVLTRLRRLASDENLSSLSASLRNAADTTGEARDALRDVRQLAVGLRGVAERLENVIARVDNEALVSAPGKVGEMADQVKQAAASVDRVARSLEERPDGLIFGREKRPPGPGEDGYQAGEGR